jgi:uncharacterized protein YgiM (DUF1202 family)
MSRRLLCAAILTLGLSCAVRADDGYGEYDEPQYPYRAIVNADDVYVRSGPGQNYYPVLRLKRGETVDVYRHDPGGWYAIRPPAESFSWVSAEFVEPGEGRMATIKGDRVVARVGSAFSDIRDVIQVRLDEGESVEVLEAKRIGTGPAAQTWYKISPPSGEFRWVSGQFIASEQPTQEVRHRDPNNNLLIARHARRQDDLDREDPAPRREREASRRDSERDEEEAIDRGADRRSSPRDSLEHASWSQRRDREPRSEPALAATRPAANRKRPGPAPGDKELLRELEDVDLELSTEVAKEPSAWNLQPLRTRTDQLLARSETALDRGRVRLVQRKVARFEDIKQRHDMIASSQLATDARNQDVVRASLGGSIGVRPDPNRFDGVGKLTQLSPAQSGVASFALVDREGHVLQYVTPAPGVNLRPYLGQDVGIQGTLGYMSDAHTQHVTAKRVSVVGNTTMIR